MSEPTMRDVLQMAVRVIREAANPEDAANCQVKINSFAHGWLPLAEKVLAQPEQCDTKDCNGVRLPDENFCKECFAGIVRIKERLRMREEAMDKPEPNETAMRVKLPSDTAAWTDEHREIYTLRKLLHETTGQAKSLEAELERSLLLTDEAAVREVLFRMQIDSANCCSWVDAWTPQFLKAARQLAQERGGEGKR